MCEPTESGTMSANPFHVFEDPVLRFQDEIWLRYKAETMRTLTRNTFLTFEHLDIWILTFA